MKTVMKKMFSLLLVAVMLIGVMPFAAFATEGESGSGTTTYSLTFDLKVNDNDNVTATRTKDGLSGDVNLKDVAEYLFPGYTYRWTSMGKDTSTLNITENTTLTVRMNCNHSNGYNEVINTQPTCTESGLKTLTCKTEGCNDSHTEVIPSLNHDWNDWVVLEAATCIATGTEKRTCKNDASHVETKTIPQNADAHNFSGSKCTLCNQCEHCGNIGSHPENCKYYCSGTTNCPNDPTVATAHKVGCLKTKCNKNGCTKDYNHEGECSVPCTKTAGCILKQNHAGACDTHCEDTHCDFDYGHSGKHSYQCPEDGCDKAVGHDGKHSNEPNYASGSHKLKVYARIWVHETKFETRLLDTITDLSGDAKIYQVIAANKDHLNAILPYDEFKALHWGETVNYLDDDKEYKDVGTRMTVGDENEVYVNLYSAEQLIVVNVHTSKTWAYDISVRIEGFRPGDLVTYEDVLKAVKKYYNVSSMKMFTYEEMCDYLDGGKADQIENFIAGEREDPYEVFISGSRKSGAYKYTADSTNPKTGDEIFVPMAVLGLSASALAVMFYLNKKRAY